MPVVHDVLRLARREVLAGVDEQHVPAVFVRSALFARPVEDQDGHGNARRGEEVRGQADHGVEQVLLDQRLADPAFGAAPEQHAVRHDHRDAAAAPLCDLDHVRG